MWCVSDDEPVQREAVVAGAHNGLVATSRAIGRVRRKRGGRGAQGQCREQCLGQVGEVYLKVTIGRVTDLCIRSNPKAASPHVAREAARRQPLAGPALLAATEIGPGARLASRCENSSAECSPHGDWPLGCARLACMEKSYAAPRL